ncbi:MAG: thioredoxin family protein [Methanosarcinaceae archaeon]|nr:thioredoxin family protein [Methanosarcinaceae archaeon]
MPEITLVYATWCHNCPKAKKLWKDLRSSYDLKYTEVDVESDEGKILVEKYSIMGVPTTIIDGGVAFVGVPSRNDAIATITGEMGR